MGNAGGRGRGAQQPTEEEEEGSAGSSSNDEKAGEHPPALPEKGAEKRSLRQSARVHSYADDSAAQAEGVLAEMGSGDDADVDWEDA